MRVTKRFLGSLLCTAFTLNLGVMSTLAPAKPAKAVIAWAICAFLCGETTGDWNDCMLGCLVFEVLP